MDFDAEVSEIESSEDDLSQLVWHKPESSITPGGNCVEVAAFHRDYAVRDSKHPNGGALVFGATAWNAFVAGIKDGQFGKS